VGLIGNDLNLFYNLDIKFIFIYIASLTCFAFTFTAQLQNLSCEFDNVLSTEINGIFDVIYKFVSSIHCILFIVFVTYIEFFRASLLRN
jgi:hypothetical protein